jgi:hypothetical protein
MIQKNFCGMIWCSFNNFCNYKHAFLPFLYFKVMEYMNENTVQYKQSHVCLLCALNLLILT